MGRKVRRAARKAARKAAGGATKALSKSVTGTINNTGKFAGNALKGTGDMAKALSKGDIKGMAGAGMGALTNVKDLIKDTGKNQLGFATGLASSASNLTPVGGSALNKAANDVNAEGNRGVNKYGDTAIDMAANYASGGTYGLAQSAMGATAGKGLGGLTDPKLLTALAGKAASTYTGIDPTMVSSAKALSSGKDLKGMALQAAGSFGGLSDTNASSLGDLAGGDVKSALINRAGAEAGLTGAQTNIGKALAGKGDLTQSLVNAGGEKAGLTGAQSNIGSALLGKGNLVNSLVSAGGEKAGLTKDQQAMTNSLASGDIKGAALANTSDPFLGGIIKQGSFDVKDIIKNASKTAAIGGVIPGQAYLPGSAPEMLAQGQTSYADAKGIQKRVSGAIKNPLAAAAAAGAAGYTIAKGDNLNSIAKKMGVDVRELAKANGITDPNKIAAGMKLNMPQSVTNATKGFTQITDKYMKDANGKTLMGPNHAPVRNANYDSVAADQYQAELQSRGRTPAGVPSTGPIAAEPSMWDRIKSGVSGAVGGVGSAIKENPNTANALLQGGAAVGGYVAGNKARDRQQAIIKKQILETQGIDELNKYTLSADRENAYADQQKFLADRISSGGFTPAERQAQTEGQLRGARAAAAGRLAGVEQQARMGQGATGAGSSLAASLMGAQSGANIQADAERQAATDAAANLERAYGTRTSALENKASTEMNLAQSKDTLDLTKQSQLALQRLQQSNLAAAQGQETGHLISQVANLGSQLILDPAKANALQTAAGNAPVAIPQAPVAQQPAPIATPGRAPASTPAKRPPVPASTPKAGALASIANPQGSSGVLAPATPSTTPAMDAMNGFLTMKGKLPSVSQIASNPQAAAQKLIADKAAQAKELAAQKAKGLVTKALPAPIASAGSKLLSNFTNPFGK